MEVEAVYQTKAGYSYMDLAFEARNLFLALTDVKDATPWDDLDDNKCAAWVKTVAEIAALCEIEQEMPWSDLVKRAVFAYHGGTSELSPPLEAVWEAVCRHTVNLIMAEDSEDLESLNTSDAFWRDWLSRRVLNAGHDREDGEESGETGDQAGEDEVTG